MIWSTARMCAFRVKINRCGSASAAKKRWVVCIRLTTMRPARGPSSLGRRDIPLALCYLPPYPLVFVFVFVFVIGIVVASSSSYYALASSIVFGKGNRVGGKGGRISAEEEGGGR